jgi:protein gp37
MGADTKIPWTDYTANFWGGCAEVSPGCDNCYARELAARRRWAEWGAGKERHFFKGAAANVLAFNRKAERTGERKKVFCMSLGDIFDNEVEQVRRDDIWKLVEQCTALDWQLLTKRIGNAKTMLPTEWLRDGLPSNVWLGITVVNQEEADRDVPKLIQTPARVRWLSVEPMLGPIRLRDDWSIDWVVVGGESGGRRRELDLGWLEDIVAQCRERNIAAWVKQDSALQPGTRGRIPDELWVHEFPKAKESKPERRSALQLRGTRPVADLRSLCADYHGEKGDFAYAAFAWLNETVFEDRLPVTLIQWALTSYGHCLGFTQNKKNENNPPVVTLHPAIWSPAGHGTGWSRTIPAGRRYALDVVLHELIHVEVNYLMRGRSGKSSHDCIEWCQAITTASQKLKGTMLELPPFRAAPTKRYRENGRQARRTPDGCLSMEQIAGWPHSVREPSYYGSRALPWSRP